MKSSLGNLLISLAIGLVAGFFIGRYTAAPEVIEVPVKIEVPVPVVKNDTVIIRPDPVTVEVPNPVNSDLLAQYDKLKDTLAKRDAYINAITKRSYSENFEDDIQTITVDADVTGTLDTLSVSYQTKPRTIPVDTVVRVETTAPKRSLSSYMETAVLQLGQQVGPSFNRFEFGIDYRDRKGNIIGISADRNFTTDQTNLNLKVGKELFKF